MNRSIKLVTRPEMQPPVRVAEKLRKVADEVESGKLGNVRYAIMVLEELCEDGKTRNYVRTSGMTNADALWLCEQGKRIVLRDDTEDIEE